MTDAPVTESPRGGRPGVFAVVRAGLAPALGAGLLLGIAPAVAESGRWVFAAAAIAAIAALCTAGSVAELSAAHRRSTSGVDGADGIEVLRDRLGVWPARVAGVTYLSGRVLASAVVAGAAGWYLTPGRPLFGAVVVLVVAAVADVLGDRVPAPALALVGVPVVAAVLLVVAAACFAIAPVTAPVPVPAASSAAVPGSDDWTGLLASAGFVAFAFLGTDRAVTRQHTSRTHLVAVPVVVATTLLIYLAIAGAALRQLGGARLAVSDAPLRDALGAADASGLGQLLALGTAIAAVVVLHGLLGEVRRTAAGMAARGELPQPLRSARVPLAVVVLLITGALVGMLTESGELVPAMAVASALCVFGWAFTNAAARLVPNRGRHWPMRVPCFGLGCSVLVSVPGVLDHPVPTLGVLAAGTLVCTACAAVSAKVTSRRARTTTTRP